MIKALKWFLALTKRLFRHPSFILALIMIPICVIAVKISSKSEHGILTIAVSSYDVNDGTYTEILDELLDGNGIINFYDAGSAQNAKNDVVYEKADCAWVFPENLTELVYNYSAENPVPLCDVISPQSSIITEMTKEKLYGILFRYISPSLSFDFIRSRADADREDFDKLYAEEFSTFNRDFVNFKFVDAPEINVTDTDYMTSPLRGLAYIAFTVCVMAAMLLCLREENEGRFNCFPLNSRFLIHFSSCFSAAVVSSVAVIMSLCLAHMNVSIEREAIITILLVLSTVGFCVLLGSVFGNVKMFSFMLPVVMISMCVLCPVFIEINYLKQIQLLLPTYHALVAVYDNSGIHNLVLYSIVIYPLCYIVYRLKNHFVLSNLSDK